MKAMRTGALIAALALASLAVGCGEDADEAPPTAPVETADPLPELPAGWSVHANRDAGFALGVPPGWTARARGVRSELRSPERLAALAVTVDRTDEVLAAPLDELASATIAAEVPGLRDVEPGEPRPLRHRYEAVALRATGVAGDEDVPERLLLAVVRREGIATFTALAARNARRSPHLYARQMERAIRSLRSRPIVPPAQTAQ